MTPIRKGTARRLGLRRRASIAEFETVLERHMADMKAAFDPRLVTLFDAERAAAAKVQEAHRRHLDALRHRADVRAERYAVALTAALRHI